MNELSFTKITNQDKNSPRHMKSNIFSITYYCHLRDYVNDLFAIHKSVHNKQAVYCAICESAQLHFSIVQLKMKLRNKRQKQTEVLITVRQLGIL